MKLHRETISKAMSSIGKSIYEHLDSHYYLAGGTAKTFLP